MYFEGDLKEIQIDCFMFFRKDIRPEWEDKKNEEGGHLLLQLKQPSPRFVNALWAALVFALLGEAWDHSERVAKPSSDLRSQSSQQSQGLRHHTQG